jgi:hypothetical protein
MDNNDYNQGIDQTIISSGDSLTDGTGGVAYPVILGQLLNRIIDKQSIGGQTSMQIASRMGSRPMLISIAGNVTNGSNAIAITSISNQFLSTPADTTTRYATGSVNGVDVLITRTVASTVETYTLKPIISQTVTIPANSLLVLDAQNNYKSAIHLMWWGRNDTPVFSNLLNLYSQQISTLRKPKRFVTIGVLSALNEINGSGNKNAIDAINVQLKATYPNNYVEITPPAVGELAFWGYTATSQDLTDISNGVFPTGTRSDNVHLNTLGYSVIAKRVLDKLLDMNWA